MLNPTAPEQARAAEVRQSVLTAIQANEVIRLPDFDPATSLSSPEVALQSVGIEPNPFGGSVGDYRYQLEGEEDLLHLIVTRLDNRPLTVEEARQVSAFVFPTVPPGLMWLKPGTVTQHFYIGHDILLESHEFAI